MFGGLRGRWTVNGRHGGLVVQSNDGLSFLPRILETLCQEFGRWRFERWRERFKKERLDTRSLMKCEILLVTESVGVRARAQKVPSNWCGSMHVPKSRSGGAGIDMK